MAQNPSPDPSNQDELANSRGSDWGEFVKTAIYAIVIALVIRTLFFEPFNIPSGSMKPTLLVGDYLFVSKPAYGYSRHSFPLSLAPIEGRIWGSKPKRGDVAVFKLPSNDRVDFIKRVIGLPGDTVQVIGGEVHINGEPIPRTYKGRLEIRTRDGLKKTMQVYRETLGNGRSYFVYEERPDAPLDNTRPFQVPDGHFFVMGDNRDNSQDSRVQSLVGYVPFENFVGRAELIFFSTNGSASLFEVWKWPGSLRFDRFLMGIGPEKTMPLEQKDDEFE